MHILGAFIEIKAALNYLFPYEPYLWLPLKQTSFVA